ncbi:MarR family winged helix-turn-helix transcriptional regulator [Pusillimonas noertemannii]|uniref:MarR family transcriptional regulator n=1 Tax=Pusillimonas noertemannii TaxID=305977 RepID=A0A2U1CKT5_9BURK|nr:MarR family winged helix-turn-helix transcriptional regulator [Pusillimonas noertemannii]NYT69162.1 winged helix-turn-helix transcriptional regulator [Pusillimonas noertemannii]PVY61629.1 MarR family transcriptional regulator [Pusillimonas noertemannii]
MGYLLNRAANIIAARFSDELKLHGINLQIWRVLAALDHKDGQSVTDLASHTAAELSYLSRSLADIEKRGLVVRVTSSQDKRTVRLSLTPAGRRLVKALVPCGEEVESMALAGIPKADVEAMQRGLQAVYHNVVAGTQKDVAMGVNRKLTVARRARQRTRD